MDSEERSEAALAALKSNKAHQYALKVYSDKLQAELSLVDKLLDTADVDEEEASVDSPGSLRIEGLTKAMGLLNGTELAQESSPFYADAQRRLRYTQVTTLHTMRPKELSILADAVRQENRRILTLRAQQRGTHPPAADAPELDENIDGLDWDRIAQSVTVASYVTRSGLECKVRWLGDRHPKYSHTVWTEEEREQARELAREVQTAGKSIDWVDIAERLGTKRTPIDVMRNAVARDFHIWDTPSEKRLQEAVGIYGLENWSLVARFVSRDATSASCQAHWYRSFDPSIIGGPWTAEEDERLKRAVIAYGKSWVDVATVMGGRTSEKCRERFFGRKSVKKGRWNDDEDELLKTAVVELGTKSWIEISERVTGRSDTQCRARWGIIGPREEQSKTSKFTEPLESNQAADSLSSPAATPTAPRKKKRKAVGTPQDTDTEEAPEPSRTAFEDTTAPSVDQMPGPSRSRPRPRPVKKGKRAAADERMLSIVSNSESATSSRTPSNQSPKKTPTSGRRKQPSRRAHGKMKGVAASEEEDSAK